MTSIWDKYRERNSVEFDLGELGMPEFRVRIKNPSMYSPAELYNMQRQADRENWDRLKGMQAAIEAKEKELQTQLDAGEIDDLAVHEELSKLEYMEPTTLTPGERMLIEWWNLTDTETNEPLELPDKHPDVLFRLPIEVQGLIKKKLGEQVEEQMTVPKASESN